jgi:hippurate hydrolase
MEFAMSIRTIVLLVCLCLIAAAARAGQALDVSSEARSRVDAVYRDVEELYIDLHRNPELSLQEEKTAATLADRLRRLGFDVTTRVGGHGVVGVLRNGLGPTLMIRTDMDALPVEEKTGLPYASQVRAKDASGLEVAVMHACGHDVHMAAWIGAATILTQMKASWRGTLMLIGQPAEETFAGAKAMVSDGLFTRFPKPDAVLAIHNHDFTPSGTVGVTPGYLLANTDSVDITIFGRGGHGAYPHTTVDPVVISARVVMALQTIVAREKDPFEPAVVTVGSIHGGTKHNIIPDDVHLQLTVRTFKSDVRERILAAIERIANAESAAALAPNPRL